VVAGEEEVVVGDMKAHPVLRHNRAVTQGGLRAYAGVPIHSASGQTIGTLCASEQTPRSWSEADVSTLRKLADVVMAYAMLGISDGGEVRMLRSREAVGVIGRGILGANQILQRVHRTASAKVKAQLLQIVDQLSQGLIAAYGAPA
jgi:signal transduction protein with GAF and PtsI domain